MTPLSQCGRHLYKCPSSLKVRVDLAGVVAHAQLADARESEHAVLVEDVPVGGDDGAGADAVLAARAREPLLLAHEDARGGVLPVEAVQQVRLHELQDEWGRFFNV